MTTERPMKPDPEDFEAVKREYGPLPDDASDEQCARHYRLAQAAKLIRLYGADLTNGDHDL